MGGRSHVPLQVAGVGQRGRVRRVLGEHLVVELERRPWCCPCCSAPAPAAAAARSAGPARRSRCPTTTGPVDGPGRSAPRGGRRRWQSAGRPRRPPPGATSGMRCAAQATAARTAPTGRRHGAARAPSAASSASTSARRAESRATSTAWSLSERSPASCSRSASSRERRRNSRSSARYQRSSRPDASRRPPPWGPVDRHATVSLAFSASKARLRRQKTTPTPDQGAGAQHQRDDPDERGRRRRRAGPGGWSGRTRTRAPGRCRRRSGPAATMLSIWWRTAMAVVAFDWATERSVQEGQRTVGLDGGRPLRRRRRSGVEGAAPDDQRDGEDDQWEGHPNPEGHAGRALSHRTHAPAPPAPPPGTNRGSSAWPGPRGTADTRPEGSITNVVGGAVTP